MSTTAPFNPTPPCHFCGVTGQHVNTNHWTGSDDYTVACTQTWEPRIDVCSDPACRSQVRDFPRKPRQARQPRRLYGDFAQLAAFHHITTDGTGRNARR